LIGINYKSLNQQDNLNFAKMRKIFGQTNHLPRLFALLIIAAAFFACELQEEKVNTDPSITLNFSTDTVFFDTVFTSLGSFAKRFKVYNPSENAVIIDRIELGTQENAAYSLVINGFESDRLNNTRLLGKDSLLVLVKVQIDPQDQDLPFIVQDSVVFETNGNIQDVKLVSWGQDGVFFRAGGVQVLSCNTVWDSLRPYVIYDSLLIPEGCTLEMQAGARVHFAPGAAMFIGGKLDVKGTVEQPVTISGIRNDFPYDNTPGQWSGIYFLQTSKDNLINYADIKNGDIGLYLGTPDEDDIPDLILSNSVISNMTFAGVQSVSSDLTMYNTLIHSCVEQNINFLAGGNYILQHNTFAALSREVFREVPSFVVSNFIPISETEVLAEDLYAVIQNNIIWGRLQDEILFEAIPEAGFEIDLQQNIIRTIVTDYAENNLINENPLFYDEFFDDYRLDTLGESPAINIGLQLGITTDILGKPRDERPDLGAFEFIPSNK
jgi:hypothetical protein